MIFRVLVIFLVSAVTLNALPFQHEACDNVDELKSDSKNCSRYYQCTNYGWVNMPCYTTLHFNPATAECDYPENVKCQCSPKKTVALSSPSCTEKEFDQLYPNPANCSTFLECSPLGLVELPCPSTLLYNDEVKKCDYPENVRCEADDSQECIVL